MPVGLPLVGALEAVARGARGPSSGRGGRVPRHLRRRRLLDRAPGPRARRAAARDAAAGGARAGARHRPRRDERPALHVGSRRQAARRAALYPATEAPDGSEAAAVRFRGVLPEVLRADAGALRGAPRSVRQHARDRGIRGARVDLRRRRSARGAIPPAAFRGAGRTVARGLPAGAHPRRRRRALRRSAALRRSRTGSISR